jgi:pyruvate dehydrogenase E2 component (dihydrolipoyllysine-residue acetyltransferase)
VPTEVIMPALGMAQETGKLLRWIKNEGDAVTKGEALMEIETDKVTVEIEAPADGILRGVCAAEGDDVPVGQAIAFVLAEGETLPQSKLVVAAPDPTTAAEAAAVQPSGSNGAPLAELGRGRVLASPKARRLATERGLRIDDVVGSGPHGAVQAADVLAWAASSAVLASPAARAGTDFGVSNGWKTMASRMQQAWHDVPHFFLERDVDATRLNSWREAVRRRAGYERLTHTDLLIAISAAALVDHPRVNASWVDGTVTGPGAINVGVAVATDDALIVPVVHGADELGLKEIATRRAEIVSRARERKLMPADVSDGTFTISNLGMFGVDSFHAIVNTPQAAILAVGRIADRPVAIDGEVVVRPMMTISLSFDHRVVDGAEGARFLDTLVALIEEPGALVR